MHDYDLYEAKLVDKYCGGDAHDTFVRLCSLQMKYIANTYKGLELDDFKTCNTSMDDSLLQVRHRNDITACFQNKLLPNVGQCNSYNVLGKSCVMFNEFPCYKLTI